MAKGLEYASLHDLELLTLVKSEDENAYNELYDRYWKELFLTAYRKSRSREVAEELTQNLFLRLWERRDSLQIQNLQSWFFNAIKFSVISHYRSLMVQGKYLDYVKGDFDEAEYSTEELLLLEELATAIDKGVALLPEKTQQVFRLSRMENRSVKEIANHLDISEKAVEYHITQSLKKMRLHLKDYLVMGLLLSFLAEGL